MRVLSASRGGGQGRGWGESRNGLVGVVARARAGARVADGLTQSPSRPARSISPHISPDHRLVRRREQLHHLRAVQGDDAQGHEGLLLDEPEMGLERQPLRTLHFAKGEIGKGLRRRRIRQGRVHCCPARLTYRYPRPALRFSLPFSTHAMLAAPSGGGTQEMF